MLPRRGRGAAAKPLLAWLSVLAIAGLVGWQFFSGADDEPDEKDAAGPFFVARPARLAPGVFLLGELSPSVAYVIETTDGLVLIDAGLEEDHELLLSQLGRLGLDAHDVKIILVTHSHGDHYLGAMKLKEISGARIHAGSGDSQVIRDAGPREAVFSTFPMDHVEIHPTDVDVELVGGETIELGDARIQAMSTPGHTPGSMCFLLERDGHSALFTGDTIMTLTGDLGTYSTYLAPRYRGNAPDYLATFHKLQELPVPDLLLPGHPRTDLGRISARLTPQDWSSLLERGIREMEELLARYDTDGADFLDGTPRELLPGLYYLGDFAGTAMYCVVHESSLILFDAPGGPELLSFLQERCGEVGLDLSMLRAVVLTEATTETCAAVPDLMVHTDCKVIASRSDQALVRGIAPDAIVIPAETAVSEYPWLPVQPLSVSGFAGTRTAYRMEWAGKRVLLSGRIPARTLGRVAELQPELWLPARPVHGQNANLYGNDWQDKVGGRR